MQAILVAGQPDITASVRRTLESTGFDTVEEISVPSGVHDALIEGEVDALMIVIVLSATRTREENDVIQDVREEYHERRPLPFVVCVMADADAERGADACLAGASCVIGTAWSSDWKTYLYHKLRMYRKAIEKKKPA